MDELISEDIQDLVFMSRNHLILTQAAGSATITQFAHAAMPSCFPPANLITARPSRVGGRPVASRG
jgi:hypothetical protein